MICDYQPLVSVVMITYKHEAFIKQAIEGVLMQETNFGVELIIADDCSPDGTSEIVQGFINQHPNGYWIKYTRHSSNKGMSANFGWALNQAKGKYNALCEGDDYWTDPAKLQKQVNFLDSNPAYMAVAHNAVVHLLDGAERLFLKKLDRPRDLTTSDCIRQWLIPTASLMYRNVLSAEELGLCSRFVVADQPLWIVLSDKGFIRMDNSVMSYYRKHPGGESVVSGSPAKISSTAQGFIEMFLELNHFYNSKYETDFKWKLVKYLMLIDGCERVVQLEGAAILLESLRERCTFYEEIIECKEKEILSVPLVLRSRLAIKAYNTIRGVINWLRRSPQ